MNVEARHLCLFLEPMTLEQTVVLWRDATACARQVQKMMELVIWNLTMGIGCTSLKLIPSVIMGFKVIQPRTHFIKVSVSLVCFYSYFFQKYKIASMTTHRTPPLIFWDKEGRMKLTQKHVSLDAQMLMAAATLHFGQMRTHAIFQAQLQQGL